MTTYQRIKNENLELKRQLLILAILPNSTSANLIKMQWRILSDIEKQIMSGIYKSEQNEKKG